MKERQPFTRNLSPENLLLGMLRLSPSHGYDLHQQLERDLRYVWRLSLSQVYNVLNRLEKGGLIAGEVLQQEERPDRKRFHLTAEGEQHFKEWLEAPVGASVHAVRIAFLSKLYFAQQMHDINLEPLWDEQFEVIKAGLERLENRRSQASGAHSILEYSLRLRVMQLETLLQWLTDFKQVWIAS
jgi:DNA-binding PadR family transcriptional regulator